MAKTYYAILSITPWATEMDIRRAYRDLSKLYHPDTTELPQDIAVENFRQINEAYAILSNSERRNEYDRLIQFSRFQYTNPVHKNLQTIDDDGLPTERPLSGGELFALLLIGVTLVACLVIAILVGWLRGDSLFPEAIALISLLS